jgi:hypothetical protein
VAINEIARPMQEKISTTTNGWAVSLLREMSERIAASSFHVAAPDRPRRPGARGTIRDLCFRTMSSATELTSWPRTSMTGIRPLLTPGAAMRISISARQGDVEPLLPAESAAGRQGWFVRLRTARADGPMSKAIHKVSDDQLEQLLISVYCINRKRRTDPLFTVRKYQQKHVRLAFRAAVWSGSDCDHPQRRTTNPFSTSRGCE